MFALVVTSIALQSHCQWMGFTLPRTKLVHDHLRPLSCQRLGPPTTFTTWISLLYVSPTNSLECQDATLLESLSNYIYYNTIIRSSQEIHGITSSPYHIHVLTPNSHIITKHYNLMPMYNQPTNSCFISYQAQQFLFIKSHNTCIVIYFMLYQDI